MYEKSKTTSLRMLFTISLFTLAFSVLLIPLSVLFDNRLWEYINYFNLIVTTLVIVLLVDRILDELSSIYNKKKNTSPLFNVRFSPQRSLQLFLKEYMYDIGEFPKDVEGNSKLQRDYVIKHLEKNSIDELEYALKLVEPCKLLKSLKKMWKALTAISVTPVIYGMFRDNFENVFLYSKNRNFPLFYRTIVGASSLAYVVCFSLGILLLVVTHFEKAKYTQLISIAIQKKRNAN